MQSIISIITGLIILVALWQIFQKAGKAGWTAIIPIYDLWVLIDIVKRPSWWLILLFVPIVNIVIYFLMLQRLAHAFGRGTGFAVGLFVLPFIFFPMIAFGDAQYDSSVLN